MGHGRPPRRIRVRTRCSRRRSADGKECPRPDPRASLAVVPDSRQSPTTSATAPSAAKASPASSAATSRVCPPGRVRVTGDADELSFFMGGARPAAHTRVFANRRPGISGKVDEARRTRQSISQAGVGRQGLPSPFRSSFSDEAFAECASSSYVIAQNASGFGIDSARSSAVLLQTGITPRPGECVHEVRPCVSRVHVDPPSSFPGRLPAA